MQKFTPNLCGAMRHLVNCQEQSKKSTAAILIVSFLCVSFFAGAAENPSGLPATSPVGNTESVRTNLYLLMPDNSRILADGVYSQYNDLYHDSVTLEDAAKFTNIRENLGLLRYNTVLAVERRPLITGNDTLFYKLWKTTQRNYQLEVITNMLAHAGLQAFFTDSYLNTSLALGLGDTTRINFAVDADPASAASNRFKIVFKSIVFHILPVSFTALNAVKQKDKVLLNWQIENEISMLKYDLEKSINGKDFVVLNTATVNGRTTHAGKYAYTDNSICTAISFYRIKATGTNGNITYSPTVKIKASNMLASLSIYPNPVTGSVFNLQLNDQPLGLCSLQLVNINGQVVYSKQLNLTSPNSSRAVQLNGLLLKGIYKLEIKTADDNITSKNMIVK